METKINATANVGTNLETTHTLDFSDRLYKAALAFIAVLGIVGVGWVFSQLGALPQIAPHEINVSGEGRAYMKPDIALINFGVTTKALKSQDAVNQNNEKMNAVIAAIKGLGVEDKDIQTTQYYLTPVYDYPTILMPNRTVSSGEVSSPAYIDSGRKFSGYSLEQQVSVKIRNFDNINAILDKATSSGATNVGELRFTIDNPEKVQAEARAMAIAKAKEKLVDIMNQSGLRAVRLVNLSEGYGNYPQPMYLEGMGGAKDMASVPPQIQTGQQEIVSIVTLTYQVK